jgi:heme/copper-type cytochrome/quinol oxidase subunit 3
VGLEGSAGQCEANMATLWFLIASVFTLGGVALGAYLSSRLTDRHLTPDSKEVVRLGTGLIGTLAALVLGLLVASAKNSFDSQNTNVKRITAI